ncbi:MAG: GatB/YqeY domain-containing protein [Rhodospirillaceae bacterium]
MLRSQLGDALKDAVRSKDQRAVLTIRLILAALKDRDICARGKGNTEGIEEADILSMLQSMVKQRQESIALYEQGGRLELAEREQEEIGVIQRFLPEPMSGEELHQAVSDTIAEVDAHGLKDMGRVMASLKQRFPGRMDFCQASAVARGHLV